jgi:hypothetical protein
MGLLAAEFEHRHVWMACEDTLSQPLLKVIEIDPRLQAPQRWRSRVWAAISLVEAVALGTETDDKDAALFR